MIVVLVFILFSIINLIKKYEGSSMIVIILIEWITVTIIYYYIMISKLKISKNK